jgi:hypothetical protein
MSKKKSRVQDAELTEANKKASEVVDGLKRLYFDVVKPLEVSFLFNDFHSSPLGVGDFYAKPNILIIGQYSTGTMTIANDNTCVCIGS